MIPRHRLLRDHAVRLEHRVRVFGPNQISTDLTAIIAYLPLVSMAILMVVASAVIIALVSSRRWVSCTWRPMWSTRRCTRAWPRLFGIAIEVVGGAAITPMRVRWEKSPASYDAGAPLTAKAWQNAPSARQPAQQFRAQARASSRGATRR